MKMTTMGRGGPEVSQFGVGAMSFAGVYGSSTLEEAHGVLDAAVEAGVTHIDTANVYGMGKSEEMIGAWLAKNPGVRDRLHIATKASITADAEGNRMLSNDPEHLEAELDKSLKRLGTDRVDLFYIHRREQARPIEEVTEALAGLIAKGKIGAFGYSEIAPSSLRRASAVHHVAAVQSEYSLSTRYPELGLVQACEELGTALVAFSPVGRTLLTDTPVTHESIEKIPFLKSNPRFQAPNLSANIAATEGFRAVAREMGEPAAALAIAWLTHKGPHVIPIPGTRSVAHFAELVRGANLTLSASDIAAINAALPVGWAHGDRYSADQWIGPERYC